MGAKSVFKRDNATLRAYATLASDETTGQLAGDLRAFCEEVDQETDEDALASFVAVFHGPQVTSEVHFERLLWRQLGLLTLRDDADWNAEVSPDPADDHFAFSLYGRAFFVVGLHPKASRDARRSEVPVLVFNPHEQFERLRRDGRYLRMRDTIRKRDERLQGTINPMVGDHGTASEARQYAGRPVPPDWTPPTSVRCPR